MDQINYNSSATKLGPTFQSFNKWCGSSWSKPTPIFESYINRMYDLEKKYSDIGWVPLALPKFELNDIDKFKEIWERESIEIKRANDPDDIADFKGMHITCNCTLDFNLHDLYKDGRLTTSQISNTDRFQQGREVVGVYTKKLYKDRFFFDLVSQVMDTFPIAEISNMMILEPIKNVAPHKEQSWSWRCPTEFRIMLHDENPTPAVYIVDDTGTKSYINLPSDTNSFCWSNGMHYYGIDYHNKPSYQLVVSAVWSPNKMDALLEHSIEKYKR